MLIKKIIPKSLRKLLKPLFTNYYDTRAVYEFPVSKKIKKFDNKVAIITGGAGEIGRAISTRLAMEGAKVYLCGRTEESLKKVEAEIQQLGCSAEYIILDVKDYNDVLTAFTSIFEKEGHVDYLICSAGGSARNKAKEFYKQDIKTITEVINTNLIGTVNCCHVAAPLLMKNKDSAIINISSIVGIGGKEKCTDYAAAKAGIIGFSKSLAIELSPCGVRVNVISPGKIQRGIMKEKTITDEIKCNYVGYPGRAEDIANAASFLLSNEAKFITGHNLIIDGGRTLGLHGD